MLIKDDRMKNKNELWKGWFVLEQYKILVVDDDKEIRSAIMHLLNDENYINTTSKVRKIQLLLMSGKDLKDIDKTLFTKPNEFKTYGDVLNAMFYVDYMIYWISL